MIKLLIKKEIKIENNNNNNAHQRKAAPKYAYELKSSKMGMNGINVMIEKWICLIINKQNTISFSEMLHVLHHNHKHK